MVAGSVLAFSGKLEELTAQSNSWCFIWDSNPSPSVSGALCGFPLPVSHPLAIVSWTSKVVEMPQKCWLAIKISSLLLFGEKKTKYGCWPAKPQCLRTTGSTEDASYNSAFPWALLKPFVHQGPHTHGAWMWTPSHTGYSAAFRH